MFKSKVNLIVVIFATSALNKLIVTADITNTLVIHEKIERKRLASVLNWCFRSVSILIHNSATLKISLFFADEMVEIAMLPCYVSASEVYKFHEIGLNYEKLY
jgi:hypothetical protein